MSALKLFLTSSVAFFISHSLYATVTNAQLESQPDFFSSNYTAYDASVKGVNKLQTGVYDYPKLSADPEGYTPFYISHYGRHGSRYHYSLDDYRYVTEALEKAAAESGLTPLGQQLLEEMKKVRDNADKRAGDLTPLGREQHCGIASRMMKNFPAVFAGDNKKIDAKSTMVVRCVLSMNAFCQELTKTNPKLDIVNDASDKYQVFLCHGNVVNEFSDNKAELDAFYKKRELSDDVLYRIFSNKNVVKKYVNKDRFISNLYYMLVALQGVDVENLDERTCSLTKVFTVSELAKQWQNQNLYWYMGYAKGPHKGGEGKNSSVYLIEKIREEADAAIAGNGLAANLRFGHDIGLLPLVALLNLDGLGETYTDLELLHNNWQDFSVVPMASNFQMVFYRKNNPNVSGSQYLVKFLVNEREVKLPASISPVSGNYYDWNVVRKYFTEIEKTVQH
ncbi:MAG: hypothetical protein IKV67_04960 [Paludibacteraceae bacterium]|nr:hypothetical protein [Paludibacteraceae bacterium]